MAKENDLLFSYAEIKRDNGFVKWEIYSYNSDGSFDDWFALVDLPESEDIEQYIREHYGKLLY